MELSRGNSIPSRQDRTEEFSVMSDPHYLSLEGRVYSLEKQGEFILNVLAIAALFGIYFAVRWYQENVGSIPGVQA